MRVNLDELQAFVAQQLRTADEAATIIQLSENLQRYAKAAEVQSIANVPRFSRLSVGYGVETWAVVLFVDLRNSSHRAEKHGARATYLTMHTYLPTMAYLIGKANAHIVGYRGDGLFAAFGLDESGNNPEGLDCGEAVRGAVGCAKAMLETIDEVVEPALLGENVPGDLRIGIGIDASKIVITRIGLLNACEVTAYGTCVNKAAHYSDKGNHEAVISVRARRLYPKSESGQMQFSAHHSGDGLKIIYPSTYRVLRNQKNRMLVRK